MNLNSTLATVAALLCSLSLRAANFFVANGDISGFKAAIQAANATLAADTISLAANGDYSFTTWHPTANPLDRTALPTITSPITIQGNGSKIRRADSDAIPEFRLLRVSANGSLTLHSATMRNGDLGPVNGDWSDSNGSGLRNDGGALVIEDCLFENNKNNHWASALHTTGPTVVSDSQFVHNTSFDGGTGALRAVGAGSVLIERCEFSENTGDETILFSGVQDARLVQCSIVSAGTGLINFGRGVRASGGVVKIANCTITDGSSAGIYVDGESAVTVTHCTITGHGQVNRPGVGIYVESGSLSLRNSILAFNNNGLPASADCFIGSDGVLLQNTRNLIQDGSCSPDFTGDPKLGSLSYYGGNTLVFPLVYGSPAIDNGNDACSEPIDQRGVARPIAAHCDIGAYEGWVFDWDQFLVHLIYRSEPYIIICDPLGDDVIDVTILGERTLPARSLIPGSLTMGNSRAGSARVLGLRDVNRDGMEDLMVEFRLAEVYRGAFSCKDVTLLEMQGQTREGQGIAGYVNVLGVER